MNTKFRVLTISVLLLLLVSYAGAGSVGTSGATFLRIHPMARSVGMGNAYTGLATGIEALTYNPAGITTVDKWDIGLSQIVYAMDIGYSYAAVARRLSDKTVIALHMTYLGTDDVQRDGNGAVIGNFSSYDFAPAFTIGYQIAPEAAAGGTIRYIRSEIFNYNANAIGLDIGLTYRPINWPGVSIGAAIQNIGTGIEFISTSSPQPLTARIGIAYSPPRSNYTLAGDLSMDREDQPRANFGAEYRVLNYLALRGGFDVGYDASFERALKLGVGFFSKVGSFDYAYESMGPSGTNHRFSYSYLGGQPHLYDRTDTRGFFAGGISLTKERVLTAIVPFTNLSPSSEYDWMSEGLKEIFIDRIKRNSDIVLSPYQDANIIIEGKYSALAGKEIWVGVRIVSVRNNTVIGFKEATISEDRLIDGATTLAGAVISAIPGR